MKKQPDNGKITALYERLSHDDERAGENTRKMPLLRNPLSCFLLPFGGENTRKMPLLRNRGAERSLHEKAAKAHSNTLLRPIPKV